MKSPLRIRGFKVAEEEKQINFAEKKNTIRSPIVDSTASESDRKKTGNEK